MASLQDLLHGPIGGWPPTKTTVPEATRVLVDAAVELHRAALAMRGESMREESAQILEGLEAVARSVRTDADHIRTAVEGVSTDEGERR